MAQPFLSIGIIFKNEQRCLERCLRSLTPLREAVPCQLVMADTGSDDGSREIAQRYADVLFDFPWINDFSAARNAVMDRCVGRWYLSLDADEWLDADIKELTGFLRANNRKAEACHLRVRNYVEKDNFSDYSDFNAVRLLRLSTGFRFQGAIHELWAREDGTGPVVRTLSRTMLHHDGYIGLNAETGKAKRQRNQALLDAKLAEEPENVRYLLQYIESSRPDPQHEDYLRRGLAAVEAKRSGWDAFGPPIFRYAVLAAKERELPEREAWTLQAEASFPKSFYTNIDIACLATVYYWEKGNYTECIRWGEKYIAAMRDYEEGKGDQVALLVSTLLFTSSKHARMLQTLTACSYMKEKQPARALELLEQLDPLETGLVKETLSALRELQVTTERDLTPNILRLFRRITTEKDETLRRALWDAFLEAAPMAFSPDVREEERARENFCRYSYTVYLPLAGQCEAGNAAAVLEAESVSELDRLLGAVERWEEFSISALLHALEQGAAFPPAGRPLEMEEMERIVRRLAQYRERFFRMVGQAAPRQCAGSWQELAWARTLVLAAVQGFDWRDVPLGLSLARAFAKTEGAFVSRCYAAEVLCEEHIQVLPPMHRFGWYSGRAFAALEAGDTAGYVRLLRAGLTTCPKMKGMVEFLTEHTPQLRPAASEELLALAERVRALLAACSPKDPAVAALRQSEAYQKVARLIEEAPVEAAP